MRWMNRKSYINISQIFIDAGCLILTYIVSVFMTDKIFRPVSAGEYLWVPVLFGMVYIFMMFTCEMYHRSTFTYQDRTLRYVLKACLLAVVFCLVMMPFVSSNNIGMDFLMLYLLAALVVISTQYLAVLELRTAHSSRWNKRAVFVGFRENIQEYLYYIRKTSFQVDIVGYVMLDNSKNEKSLGDIQDIASILKDNIVDEVIFAVPCGRLEEIRSHVLMCKERGLTVKLAMDFFDTHDSKSSVHTVGTIPVFTWQTTNLNDLQSLLKRCVDLIGALIGLCIFVTASVFIIPLIKLNIRGSAFIRRTYLSVNGRPFTLLFFRTAAGQSIENEKINPYTLTGKFLRRTGLDHLPMFWSVFRGDMSLVGSLPVSAADLNGLTNKQFGNISIKPGLTGIWRFEEDKGDNGENYMAELNRRYIQRWSLRRDLWLLLKTIALILATIIGLNKSFLLDKDEDRHQEMKYYLPR